MKVIGIYRHALTHLLKIIIIFLHQIYSGIFTMYISFYCDMWTHSDASATGKKRLFCIMTILDIPCFGNI